MCIRCRKSQQMTHSGKECRDTCENVATEVSILPEAWKEVKRMLWDIVEWLRFPWPSSFEMALWGDSVRRSIPCHWAVWRVGIEQLLLTIWWLCAGASLSVVQLLYPIRVEWRLGGGRWLKRSLRRKLGINIGADARRLAMWSWVGGIH